MKYKISYKNPDHHFINIQCVIDAVQNDSIEVQLPAWRPGRYELGNFAKNVKNWKVTDATGNLLSNIKITKDRWKIDTAGNKEIYISYSYYAAEINAGSSYLDGQQLYINPVNCLLYVPGRENEKCEVDLEIPEDYKIACSLKQNKNTLFAESFHDLVDAPFIASNSLKHFQFVLDGVEINLWFQGECKPISAKLVNDFFIFVNEHFLMMKEFPGSEYHFLFQILPFKFYHGVEHLNSTVIALGPSYDLMKGSLYENLLGISSHEFFHVWNVKAIRPADMMPYDYSRENYSKLGYVCEGITTYYGDLLLYRSGVFGEKEYYSTFNENLQKHYDNFGRMNLSVSDSSYDTWLDGYVPGIPGRKVSIYTEGALAAFLADIRIRKSTGNDFSLDDVMRELYEHFGKKGKGYSEQDYRNIVEKVSGTSFEDYFAKVINAPYSFEKDLEEALDYLGLFMLKIPSSRMHESKIGFRGIEENGSFKITSVVPDSPAYNNGLAVNDRIIAVNGMELHNNLADWVNYFDKDGIELLVSKNSILSTIKINGLRNAGFFNTYKIDVKDDVNNDQIENYIAWAKRKPV